MHRSERSAYLLLALAAAYGGFITGLNWGTPEMRRLRRKSRFAVELWHRKERRQEDAVVTMSTMSGKKRSPARVSTAQMIRRGAPPPENQEEMSR